MISCSYNRATNILASEEWRGLAGEIARTGEEDPLALVDDPELREIMAVKWSFVGPKKLACSTIWVKLG